MIAAPELVADADNIIGVAEAAVIVGISPATAAIYVVTGRLPAQKVCGRYLIRRSAAEELRAARKRERDQHASAAATGR
jgi:predicted site-specific integrase-resolvase